MDLEKKSKEIRRDVLGMIHCSGSSHVGSALSVVDVLTVLYFNVLKIDPKKPGLRSRDKFILSKGHASSALYATLAHRGFFPKTALKKFCSDESLLEGHPNVWTRGVEATTGSLGHGLPMGVGMAVANKVDSIKGRIFVLLGDGECNEGSVWEAAMLAGRLRLDNIIAIVDSNKLQAFDRAEDICPACNLVAMWKACGWAVREVDGHEIEGLIKVFSEVPFSTGKPSLLFAHTTKGKGVSYMENRLEWHYKCPNREQMEIALSELK